VELIFDDNLVYSISFSFFLPLIKGDCNDFGCEHLLDGNTYSMEGHLVHYNSKYKNFQEAVDKPDGLAVTGFFIQAAGDKECAEFKKLSDAVERVQKPNSKARLASDCLSFLKLQELEKHYYR
jgi:carbonic anhydrase